MIIYGLSLVIKGSSDTAEGIKENKETIEQSFTEIKPGFIKDNYYINESLGWKMQLPDKYTLIDDAFFENEKSPKLLGFSVDSTFFVSLAFYRDLNVKLDVDIFEKQLIDMNKQRDEIIYIFSKSDINISNIKFRKLVTASKIHNELGTIYFTLFDYYVLLIAVDDTHIATGKEICRLFENSNFRTK